MVVGIYIVSAARSLGFGSQGWLDLLGFRGCCELCNAISMSCFQAACFAQAAVHGNATGVTLDLWMLSSTEFSVTFPDRTVASKHPSSLLFLLPLRFLLL